jgi:type VI protein secretion system component VasF
MLPTFNRKKSLLFSRSTAAPLKRSSIVMQSSEIQQRFNHIEQTIHQAAQVCQSATTVPMDLKDCVQQLDRKSGQARKIMQQSQDEDTIRQCVYDLEQLGDRAKDACQRAGNVDDELKSAVMQAHRELSDLKHELH